MNRDSAATAVRESVKKEPAKKRQNRLKSGARPPESEVKRVKQPGHIQTWKGYKFHLDVSGTVFPMSACVTEANVHDS